MAAATPRTTEDVVCPFCSLACDDLVVEGVQEVLGQGGPHHARVEEPVEHAGQERQHLRTEIRKIEAQPASSRSPSTSR